MGDAVGRMIRMRFRFVEYDACGLEVQPQVNPDCEFLLFVSVCIDLLGQDSTSHRRVQFRLAPFASVQSICRLHVFLSVKL